MGDYEDQDLPESEEQQIKKIMKTARMIIARATHHLDQLSAKCRDENRAPTQEEWSKLEALLG